MITWKDLPYIHRLLLCIGVVYAFDAAGFGIVSHYLRLLPLVESPQPDFWRFFTYPFALPIGLDAIISMFTTSLIFYYYGPELERLLTRNLFYIVLVSFLLFHGFTFFLTIPFAYPLAGMSAAALMFLFAFAYSFPRSQVRLLGTFKVRTVTLLLVLLSLNVLPHLFVATSNLFHLFAVFLDEFFALVAGLIVAQWISLRKEDTAQFTSKEDITERIPAYTSPEEDSDDAFFRPRKTEYIKTVEPEQYFSDEDKLNAILDKISAQGTGSLLPEERQYLENYSKKL